MTNNRAAIDVLSVVSVVENALLCLLFIISPGMYVPELDTGARARALPRVSSNAKCPPKVHEKVFLQKDLKKEKNSVGSDPMINNILTDNITPNWNRIPKLGIQPLTGSSLASGYTARPLSSNTTNGLTVCSYTLDEKEEIQKGSAEALQRILMSNLRDNQRRDSNRLYPTRVQSLEPLRQ